MTGNDFFGFVLLCTAILGLGASLALYLLTRHDKK